MIQLTVRMNVSKERRDELVQTIRSLYQEGCTRKGLLNHRMLRDLDYEDVLQLIQEWETREDLDEHMDSDTFRILMGALNVLPVSREIRCHTVLDPFEVQETPWAPGLR